MTSIETPEWVRDAVFYQIFPDRFARGQGVSKPSNLEPWDSPATVHGFKGGDLIGVAEHLDYLQDLGVTAIYLNPIFQSTANHRYHTYDYYHVDPLLGGNAAFLHLLEKAHERGLRVVLDGVFNHASRGFFQFNDILENGASSPYIDWFSITEYPPQAYGAPKGRHGYAAWWDLPALPKLNVATHAVREFLLDVACHWIRLGADGWRLDVPAEIDDDGFWREFRCRVKAVNPQAYIVGEIWHDAERWLQGDQFDAVMNYLLARACLGFFVGDALVQEEVARTGYRRIDALDGKQFAAEVDRMLALYPPQVTEVQFNLLGSHDTPRFRTLARGDVSGYKLATLFQMTCPGAPSIYYGDEIGMEGGHDPGCREAFPWDVGDWDLSLRDYVGGCISLRTSYPSLRRGSFQWLLTDREMVAYGRRLGAETVLAALNRGRQPASLRIPVDGYLDDGTVLRDLSTNETCVVAGGVAEIQTLKPRSGRVWVAQG